MNLEFLTSSNDVTITFCGTDITKYVTELSIQEGQTPEGIPSYDTNIVSNYAQAPNSVQIHLGYFNTSDSDDMLNRIFVRQVIGITKQLVTTNGSLTCISRFRQYIRSQYNVDISKINSTIHLALKKYANDVSELQDLLKRSNMTDNNFLANKLPSVVVDLACKNVTSKFFYNINKYYNRIIVMLARLVGDRLVVDEKIKEYFFMGIYKELNIILFSNRQRLSANNSSSIIDDSTRSESAEYMKYFGINLFGPSSTTLLTDGDVIRKNKIIYAIGRFDEISNDGLGAELTQTYNNMFGVASINQSGSLVYDKYNAEISTDNYQTVDEMITNTNMRLTSVVKNVYLYNYYNIFKTETFTGIIPVKSTLPMATISQLPASKYDNSLLDIGAVNILKQDPDEQGKLFYKWVLEHPYLVGYRSDDNTTLSSTIDITFPIIDPRFDTDEQIKLVDVGSLDAYFLSFNFSENTSVVTNVHDTDKHLTNYNLALSALDSLDIVIPEYDIPDDVLSAGDTAIEEYKNEYEKQFYYKEVVDVDKLKLLICEDDSCQSMVYGTIHKCSYDGSTPNYLYKCSLDGCPKPSYMNGIIVSNMDTNSDKLIFINSVNDKLMTSLHDASIESIELNSESEYINALQDKILLIDNITYYPDSDGNLTLNDNIVYSLDSFVELPTTLINTNSSISNFTLEYNTRPNYTYDVSYSMTGENYSVIHEYSSSDYGTKVIPVYKCESDQVYYFRVRSVDANMNTSTYDIITLSTDAELVIPKNATMSNGDLLPGINIYWDSKTHSQVTDIPSEYLDSNGDIIPGITIDSNGDSAINYSYLDQDGYILPGIEVDSNYDVIIPLEYLDPDGNIYEYIGIVLDVTNNTHKTYIPYTEYVDVNDVVIPFIYECSGDIYVPTEYLDSDGNVSDGIIVSGDTIQVPYPNNPTAFINYTKETLTLMDRLTNIPDENTNVSVIISDEDDESTIENYIIEYATSTQIDLINGDADSFVSLLNSYELSITFDDEDITYYPYEDVIATIEDLTPNTKYTIKYTYTLLVEDEYDDNGDLIVDDDYVPVCIEVIKDVYTIAVDYTKAKYVVNDTSEYFGITVDSSTYLKKYKNQTINYWSDPNDVEIIDSNMLITIYSMPSSADIIIDGKVYVFDMLIGDIARYEYNNEYYLFGFDNVTFGMLDVDSEIIYPLAYYNTQDIEKTLILKESMEKINNMISTEIDKIDISRLTYESITPIEYNKLITFMTLITDKNYCPSDKLFFIYDKGGFKICLHTIS